MDRIKAIVDSGEMRSCLYLVKNGVPFDVAFSLPQHEVVAWTIIFGELDGGKWSWSSMSWVNDA